jgi:hypothetical protein
MHHLSVYVPVEYVESLKSALFAAGAGRIGNYEHCCWQTEGEGQFRPMVGSKPFIGTEHLTERVREVKLEMVCADERVSDVIKALKKSHPYETPAYHLIKVVSEA